MLKSYENLKIIIFKYIAVEIHVQKLIDINKVRKTVCEISLHYYEYWDMGQTKLIIQKQLPKK